MANDNMLEPAIGGVFPLGDADLSKESGQSILEVWLNDADAYYCFHNARSALHHVIRDRDISRLWLPAYLCPAVLQAVENTKSSVSYYPLDQELQPNIEVLKACLNANDAILTINYFGRAASARCKSFLSSLPDIFWIEDCAQALDSGDVVESDVRIFSPRKHLGAPDGGVLVDRHGKLNAPRFVPLEDDAFTEPYRMRLEDKFSLRNEEWYRAYRIVEDAHSVTAMAMSGLSRNILESQSLGSISKQRIENYQHLHSGLSDIALFNDTILSWTPLCFPILSEKAGEFCEFLSERRVFAPRYWRAMPSSKSEFSREHRLSDTIVGLPCDQRYSIDEMDRIIALVRGFLQ